MMRRGVDWRFVGRTEELEDFGQILANPGGERRIKFISGPGGIGKTWLMRKMIEAASKKPKVLVPPQLIDMYSTQTRHTEGVMDAVVARLVSLEVIDAAAFFGYDQAKQVLNQARENPNYSSQGLRMRLMELEKAFGACLRAITKIYVVVLAFDTFEHVQDLPVGKWILDEDGLQMPNLICIIASRKPDPHNPNAPQLAGFRDEEVLDFYAAYTQSAFDNPLVDTGEQKRDNLDFLKQLSAKEEIQGNPLMLGLAIHWRELGEFDTHLLQEKADEDFKKKLVWPLRSDAGSGSRNLGNIELDEPMYQTLVCMAYLNRRFNRFFLDKLVQHHYIRLGTTTTDRIWEQLQQDHLFFIKDRPEGEVQLHDELALMFQDYLIPDFFADPTGEDFHHFHTDILRWYETLIETTEIPERKAVLQVEKLLYILQYVEHLAKRPSPPEEWVRESLARTRQLLREYRRERSDILDHLLLNELTPDMLERFTPEQGYDVMETLADIAKRINLLEQSAELWEKAVALAREMEDAEKQVLAWVGQHNSTWQRDPQASFRLLELARSLCERKVSSRLPKVLYEIGFTYRQIGDLHQAVAWYEKAKEKARLYLDRLMMPTILNDQGYNYLLMGDYKQADALIKAARQARVHRYQTLHEQREEQCEIAGIGPEGIEECGVLEDEIHDAALKVGMSYSTLGDMRRFAGDMAKAQVYYNAAVNFFEQASSPYWQVIALCSRGETLRRYATIRYDAGQEESSAGLEAQAEVDIRTSLELCERYGFEDKVATANRRMGRLFHDRVFRASDPDEQRSLMDQALRYFELGLDMARKTNDMLEELENLTEIAFLADDRLQLFREHYPRRATKERVILEGYIRRFQEAIEKYKNRTLRIHQFPVFEHLLEIEQAAFYHVQGQYKEALDLYIKGYVGMASDPGYGSARYRQHLDHLLRQIRQLPNADLEKQWCERFKNVWQTTDIEYNGEMTTLADIHPELIEEIDLHLLTGFLYQ